MIDIFISYRRTDSSTIVGRIIDRLESEFGSERIFRDLDSIEYGHDFSEIIYRALKEAKVMLAIIGENWIDSLDENGTRRLDDAKDWVRIEISNAINYDINIIPVLVGNASMPSKHQLPDDLQPLALRSATKVRNDPDFDNDIEQLIVALKKHLSISKNITRNPLAPILAKLSKRKSTLTFSVFGLAVLSFSTAFLFKYPDMDGMWKTTDGLEGCYCNIGPFIKANLVNANNQKHLLSGFIDLPNNRAVVTVERIPANFQNDINKISINNLTSERYEGVSTWTLSVGTPNSKPVSQNHMNISGSKVSKSCSIDGFSCNDFYSPSNMWKSVTLVFKSLI